MDYPVLEILPHVKQAFAKHNIVILQAPPGAGKSTILPLHLRQELWLGSQKIIMLEPRRLAARSVAMRMANLLEEDIGQSIGYRVRFESRVSSQTQVEVVTEGILTRMIQGDNALTGVGLLIYDEFHERSLQADLALALSLQVQQVLREDLRILIMSATLDGEKLSSTLGAPVITSNGRQHPVMIRYAPGDNQTPLHVRMAKAIRKVLNEEKGDVLAFFPGVGEIQRTAGLLEQENLSVSLHALFGDLPFKEQQQAILPHLQGQRKVVLATSIAETSLTIEGISIVIDCGYARVPRFDPRSGLTRLETVAITKDAADQRAGRAGRLGPGVCYRLWRESFHSSLQPNRKPEILEADLAPLLLELSQWGIKNVSELTWLTPPPAGSLNQAKDLLHHLGALENNTITDRGKKILKLPAHPRIAHMLLKTMEHSAAAIEKERALATDIAALLEERDPLPKESGADMALRIEALRRWRSGERVSVDRNNLERVEKLATAWRKLLQIPIDNGAVSDKLVGKLIFSAYPERIARQTEKNTERYKLANGRMVKLPSHDPLMREPWLAVAQLDAGTSGEGKIFLAAPLDEQDLSDHAVEKEKVTWNDERGMVVAHLEKRVGSLLLSSKPIHTISKEKRIQVLCEIIREKGLKTLGWDDRLTSWQARVMSLFHWRKEEMWPNVSDECLLSTLETWLNPFLSDISKKTELQKLDPNAILPTILPWQNGNKLDRLVPDRIEVPSGSMIRLNYFADGRPPVMEVRLQEMFGLLDTPTVNEGRNKIMLHLLSPGFKPVQVTQDLKSFWSATYAEVRKELRTRYPKHSWPENPWTAEAVRGGRARS